MYVCMVWYVPSVCAHDAWNVWGRCMCIQSVCMWHVVSVWCVRLVGYMCLGSGGVCVWCVTVGEIRVCWEWSAPSLSMDDVWYICVVCGLGSVCVRAHMWTCAVVFKSPALEPDCLK